MTLSWRVSVSRREQAASPYADWYIVEAFDAPAAEERREGDVVEDRRVGPSGERAERAAPSTLWATGTPRPV